jgi:AraC-like DNA-binding protein
MNQKNLTELPSPAKEFSIVELPLHFVAVEPDLLLMPSKGSFKRIAVDCNYDDIGNAVNALTIFQQEFGNFQRIVAVGDSATLLADRLSEAEASNEVVTECETLIIIDRGADLASALITEPTIEGDIWAHCPDNFGQVGRVELHEGEPFFRTLRSLSSAEFGDWILRFEEWQQWYLNEVNTNPEVKPVVSAILEKHRARRDLMDLANEAYLDRSPFYDAIVKSEANQLLSIDVLQYALNLAVIANDWANALRLIALRAVCGLPLSETQLSDITDELRMEFGDAIEEALLDLDKVGLLSTRESQFRLPRFPSGELFPDTKSDERLQEISLACGFVRPSTVIVKRIVNGELDWLQRIKGLKLAVRDQSAQAVTRQTRRVFVFFVGGVTLSEVSQFRKFGRERMWGCEYLVGATDLIQPGRFMSQFIPALNK